MPYNETPMKGKHMSIDNPQHDPSTYNHEMNRLLDKLKTIEPENTEEYKAVVANMQVLHGIKDKDAQTRLKDKELDIQNRTLDVKLEEINTPKPWDRNAILAAVASIIGLAFVLGYEETRPLVTKALGFVPKIRWPVWPQAQDNETYEAWKN